MHHAGFDRLRSTNQAKGAIDRYVVPTNILALFIEQMRHKQFIRSTPGLATALMFHEN